VLNRRHITAGIAAFPVAMQQGLINAQGGVGSDEGLAVADSRIVRNLIPSRYYTDPVLDPQVQRLADQGSFNELFRTRKDLIAMWGCWSDDVGRWYDWAKSAGFLAFVDLRQSTRRRRDGS
jgi:hypothetical protein